MIINNHSNHTPTNAIVPLHLLLFVFLLLISLYNHNIYRLKYLFNNDIININEENNHGKERINCFY